MKYLYMIFEGIIYSSMIIYYNIFKIKKSKQTLKYKKAFILERKQHRSDLQLSERLERLCRHHGGAIEGPSLKPPLIRQHYDIEGFKGGGPSLCRETLASRTTDVILFPVWRLINKQGRKSRQI